MALRSKEDILANTDKCLEAAKSILNSTVAPTLSEGFESLLVTQNALIIELLIDIREALTSKD